MITSQKKILIIEDEAPLRQALFDKFSREGFQVVQAKNGKEGLDVAVEERPDIILLDLVMPKVGGLAMLKSLRHDEWGREVPVIILTNLNDAENVSKAIESGAYEFLVKSDCKLNELVNRVKSKLGIS